MVRVGSLSWWCGWGVVVFWFVVVWVAPCLVLRISVEIALILLMLQFWLLFCDLLFWFVSLWLLFDLLFGYGSVVVYTYRFARFVC